MYHKTITDQDRQNDFKVLQEGSTDPEVVMLQQQLKLTGFFPGIITGSFGPDTKTGVIAFQQKYELDPDGIVGPLTWAKLLEVNYGSNNRGIYERQIRPTLRLGDTGEAVGELQRQLQQLLYYNGSINNTFDKNTENAVKEFQINNRLLADGIVGRNTWDELFFLYGELSDCEDQPSTPSPGGIVHVVKAGDTLYSIARTYGTTVDEIKRLNRLTSNALTIGQKLDITQEVTEPQVPSGDTYVVRLGDTLYSIARNHNMTVDELKRINNLTSNTLSVGQMLYVKQPVIIPEVPSTNTYVVKAGDTLYSIARNLNTTVDELKKINNLTSNTLTIGQLLNVTQPATIPETPSTSTYVVRAGDTLYGIARTFNTTVDEIKRLNNLTSNALTIGQQLILSSGTPETPKENYYVVQSGDSLYSIAKKFGTTVNELKALNNLTSNLLSIGQRLTVLQTREDRDGIQTITVTPIDSLYSIAKRYDIAVSELKNINRLSNDLLNIGQVLKIPNEN